MQTLYLNGWQVEARLDDRRVVVTRRDTDEERQVALFALERVVCIGQPKVSMPLLHALMKAGIPVVFMTGGGRWLNTLTPPRNGNALRRLRQYESMRDSALALAIAKSLVDAKIHNMRRMLQRWAANRGLAASPEQQAASLFLKECRCRLRKAATLDEARGFEGAATARYFERLGDFFPQELPFAGRSRRPPRDPVNALLSWAYAIVTAEIDSALHAVDMDPCLGYLHEISTGRPSLALDLLEPLRAPLCDAIVINMAGHAMVTQGDFSWKKAGKDDAGGVHLESTAKRAFFNMYEQAMARPFTPARQKTAVTFRKVIQDMALAVCRATEGHKAPDFFHVA